MALESLREGEVEIIVRTKKDTMSVLLPPDYVKEILELGHKLGTQKSNLLEALIGSVDIMVGAFDKLERGDHEAVSKVADVRITFKKE